jgi:hypothetical protein
MLCNLENAYLNAPCREKIWFEGGIECGEDHGKVCTLTLWTKERRSCISFLSGADITGCCYTSSKVDPDVWLHKAAKDDGFEYYEMLFVYVDDILALSHHAKNVIKEITKFY